MADMGISASGQAVEERFRMLTGAVESERAALGDAVLDGCHIEIKKASSTTLNQIRAVKYIPLVAFHTRTSTWFVVPAPDVVALLRGKSRGQHTENPFESATLSINAMSRFAVADESDLADAVRAAIARGDDFPEVRELMGRILADSKALATQSIAEVRELLAKVGMTE